MWIVEIMSYKSGEVIEALEYKTREDAAMAERGIMKILDSKYFTLIIEPEGES